MEQEKAEKERQKEEEERRRKREEVKRKKRMLEAAFEGDIEEIENILKEVSLHIFFLHNLKFCKPAHDFMN